MFNAGGGKKAGMEQKAGGGVEMQEGGGPRVDAEAGVERSRGWSGMPGVERRAPGTVSRPWCSSLPPCPAAVQKEQINEQATWSDPK